MFWDVRVNLKVNLKVTSTPTKQYNSPSNPAGSHSSKNTSRQCVWQRTDKTNRLPSDRQDPKPPRTDKIKKKPTDGQDQGKPHGRTRPKKPRVGKTKTPHTDGQDQKISLRAVRTNNNSDGRDHPLPPTYERTRFPPFTDGQDQKSPKTNDNNKNP